MSGELTLITIAALYVSATGRERGGGAQLSDNQSEISVFPGDSKPGGVKKVTSSTATEQK